MAEHRDAAPRRALPARDDETPHAAPSSARRFAADESEPSKVAGESGNDDAASPLPAGSPRPGRAMEPSQRRRWPWVAGLAGLLVVAVVAVAWFARPLLMPGPTTPSIDPVSTYLLQEADLAPLRTDTLWTASSTDTTIGPATPQARCVLPATETTPSAASSMVRTFSPVSGLAGGLLHQVDAYADADAATVAYDERIAQLGSCPHTTALLVSTDTVDGLADAAMAFGYRLQGTQDEFHTLVVSRTGERVNIVDATQPDTAVEVAPLLEVLATASTRQCASGGTCPGTPATTPVAPPVVAPAGWLAGVDLPRVTPGAGIWRGVDAPEVNLVGTRCEAVDLNEVPVGGSLLQRTYVLADDPAAGTSFGIDEALRTFASEAEAQAYTDLLTTNIDGCAGRTPTAEVARTGEVGDPGVGTAWAVTQRTDESTATAKFRVSVVRVGSTVIYLMANPTAEADFSDEGWTAVSQRAAQRAAQLA